MRLRALAATIVLGAAMAASAAAQVASDPLLTALSARTFEHQSDRDAMVAALNAADSRHDIDDAVYAAGMALGGGALASGDLASAHSGYKTALAHAGTDTSADVVLRRGRARIGDGVTDYLDAVANHGGTTGHNRASATLEQISVELYPYAVQRSESPALTPFQAAYAEALTWAEIARAGYSERPIEHLRDLSGAEMCEMRLHGDNDLERSLGLAHNGSGFVVFRLLTDDSGATTTLDVAYTTSQQDYTRAISRLVRLHAQRATHAPAGCTIPHVIFQPIVLG